jgi:putative ATP-grasp target RiPP
MTLQQICAGESESPGHRDLGARRPWGTTRMRPYDSAPTHLPARYEVDPETQLGVYYDAAGHVIEAGKHGTIANTQTPHMTNQDGKQSIDGYDPDSVRD